MILWKKEIQRCKIFYDNFLKQNSDLNLFYSTEDKKLEASKSYYTKKNSKVIEVEENSEEGDLNNLNDGKIMK